MRIVGSKLTGWELIFDDDPEPICVAENCSFEEALDAFVANMPEYMDRLDAEFKCDDFVGNGTRPKERRERSSGSQRKRGSGARFRELMMQGKSNEECLRTVRAEFPESVATLSDAAWNRALLRKNPEGFDADGSKKRGT